jgi:diguanylate cyclase (GGDEF)-like protein
LRFAAQACLLAALASASPHAAEVETPSNASPLSAFAATLDDAAQAPLRLRYAFGDAFERPLRRLIAESLQQTSTFARAKPHWQRLQTLYARAGDAPGYLAVQHALAEMDFFLGHYDDAWHAKQRERAVARRYAQPLAEARAESGLGVIARRRGQLDQAMVHFQRALDLRQALHDGLGEAETLVQLSSAHRNKGDYTRALNLLLRSLDIRRELGEVGRPDLSLRALGVLYREVEDFDKAREVLLEALQSAQSMGDRLALSPTLGSLAALHNDRGEPNQALTMAQRALEIDREYGNRSGIALGLLESGRARMELRDAARAQDDLDQALALAQQLGQPALSARARISLATIAEQRGDLALAERLLQDAQHNVTGEDAKPQLYQAMSGLERVYTAQGRWQDAANLAQRRAQLREELLGVRQSRRLAGLSAMYEQQAQTQQIALLTKDNQIQGLQLQRERLRRYLGFAAIVALSGWAAWLIRRVRTERRHNAELVSRNREIAEQGERLREANGKLEAQARELYQAAITDPLTGIAHRGHLLHKLRECIQIAIAERSELALLMTDFDHFKSINDNHGHLFGDRVLVASVGLIAANLRGSDFFGRYGGEELLIVLPRTDAVTANAVGERLRDTVARTLSHIDERRIALTVSIGVAVLSRCANKSMEALISAADIALYAAKTAGRNRVMTYPAGPNKPFDANLPEPTA